MSFLGALYLGAGLGFLLGVFAVILFNAALDAVLARRVRTPWAPGAGKAVR